MKNRFNITKRKNGLFELAFEGHDLIAGDAYTIIERIIQEALDFGISEENLKIFYQSDNFPSMVSTQIKYLNGINLYELIIERREELMKKGSALSCRGYCCSENPMNLTCEEMAVNSDMSKEEVCLSRNRKTQYKLESPLRFDYSTNEGRKDVPLFTGLVQYFPDALKHVAHCSEMANKQHNGEGSTHWDKSKSKQELDSMLRHLFDSIHEDVDSDGIYHLAKVAWRSLAELQRRVEGISIYKNY